ncbi:MAG: hypothetical protein ABJC19_07105 [Gemmatimonadota bacterium]
MLWLTRTTAHRSLSLLAAATLACAVSLVAQTPRRNTVTDVDFLKDPSGTQLVRLNKGASVVMGASRAGWQEVTIEGWVIGNAMRDDKRDGFDVAVNLGSGTPIRTGIGTGATIGQARAGALFNRLETKSGWIQVRRTGWVAQTAIATATAAAKSPPPAAPPPPAPTEAAAGTSSAVTVAAGTALSAQPNGPPVGALETAVRAEVNEHRAGWTRITIEAWVRDAAIGVANAGGITAADLRDNPDKYVGQSVDWSLQVIAVQKADELRPELPLGQPYVLARGPLPETGFVYLLVPQDEAERFRSLAPLAQVQVRATIRAGRTRFLPTPVLTFVRRLD